MLGVELIGPSGSGKTTFLNKIAESRGHKSFMTRSEARDLLKENSIKNFILQFWNSLSSNYKDSERINILQSDKDCSHLMDLFIQNLYFSDLNAWQKVRLFDYYWSLIYEFYRIDNIYEGVVVFDEGIIHNGGLHNIDINNGERQKLRTNRILPKAVIVLTINSEDHLKRIHSRFNDNNNRRLNPLYLNVSDDELLRIVERSIIENKEKIRFCEKLKIPIFKVPSTNDERSIIDVNEFIEETRQNIL